MVSYSDPKAPTLPATVGLDAEIQRLQLLLAEQLPWLQVSYGKAYRASRKVNNKLQYFPEVYVGGREYRDVLPNDNVVAQSFFYPTGPATNPEQEPQPLTLSLKQTCDLFVWGNLQKIRPTVDYRFEHELLIEACRVLNDDGQVRIVRAFTTQEDIFKGFSLEAVPETVLRQPFFGFRVQLELQVTNVLC